MTTLAAFRAAGQALRAVPPLALAGEIAGLSGLMVEIAGLSGHAAIGSRVWLRPRRTPGAQPVPILAEIVGFRDRLARAMAFGKLDGLGPGAAVIAPARATPHGIALAEDGRLAPGPAWLGRVIDPLGRPLDGRGPLAPGPRARPVRAAPPDAATRARLGPPIGLGVRA
ncbi:MAG: hypothetical protein KGI51_09600, partial [Rhodospirillales bacterium]|nr:hypothetical protein [Rhodospirillales bacterium]